jgi:predicted O-linked N-acetylglucosamine transferase (SPINDLY family)
MSTEELSQRLTQAEACRRASRWQEALTHYLYAEPRLPEQAAIKHNLAVCYLGMGEAQQALRYCDAALRLNKVLWQSEIIKAKALSKVGSHDEAMALLLSLLQRYPNNAEVRLELAALSLHELGDAALSQRLVQAFVNDPVHGRDATLTTLMSQLYERDGTAEELTKAICSFADQHLVLPAQRGRKRARRASSRMRVGLISPLFSCSPVYFFCIGALKLLACEADLVIFSRRMSHDWATLEFQTAAHEWFDVAGMESEALTSFIRKQDLDVLLDMGGWMDPVALRALSSKPAKRMYKWVGGQSATTGIRAFDGMLSDEYQTPRSLQHLYVEPLILLDSGYVTYTPPPYMPQAAMPREGQVRLGVIANPAKISRDFLHYLRRQIGEMSRIVPMPLTLCFIDKRYRHPQLTNRIGTFLRGIEEEGAVAIEFIAPTSHRSYLDEVGQLTAVVDTFPYSGGLTSIEALSLGVPCLTRPGAGMLFSERHTLSHCKYAGVDLEHIDLAGWARDGLLNNGKGKHAAVQRTSLLRAGSGRLDHAALAANLWRQFRLPL